MIKDAAKSMRAAGAPTRVRLRKHRVWLEGANLFKRDATGMEVLSAEGKTRLDETITELLNFPRNGPLMLEGFAERGRPPSST